MSNYFYPEMIPEPDYSDSEEDSGSEDDYTPNANHSIERLRDLTEVYISSGDAKKPPKTSNKQPKTAPKTGTKGASNKTRTQSGKTSPKVSPTPRSKSPAKPSGLASAPTGRTKSPEGTRRISSKTKSPTRPTTTLAIAEEEITQSPAKARATDMPASDAKAAKKVTAASRTPTTAARQGVKSSTSKTYAVKTPPIRYIDSVSSETLSGLSSDDELLIKPKKVYQVSTERLKLHKELKFNQKYGKLAPSKTELQLALERYTENKVRRDLSAEEKTSLEKILEYQAKKIEMQEAMDKNPAWLERLQTPPISCDAKTDEFYRVHARVVSSNPLTQCFLPENDQCECSSVKTLVTSDSGSDS